MTTMPLTMEPMMLVVCFLFFLREAHKSHDKAVNGQEHSKNTEASHEESKGSPRKKGYQHCCRTNRRKEAIANPNDSFPFAASFFLCKSIPKSFLP